MTTRPRGGADSRCPACRAPILRQLVGDRAALKVTADLTPLTPEQQAEARGPNRLIWCLRPGGTGPGRLVWLTPWHPADCPHPHLADHRCPPTTLF
ncbi:hypothetical protein [Streptomyces bullii]|uniref:Uncharacterized protein n=1 Tax=Streptomyces bullii TaxID=349910 RepID=A0ABW0UJ52_9ACTN